MSAAAAGINLGMIIVYCVGAVYGVGCRNRGTEYGPTVSNTELWTLLVKGMRGADRRCVRNV